ncbi:MAG: arsenate reductase (glutaredoxin) [Bacteroidales bacterium]|nr:arsenate reductase (glutaredoxin) [Bacteroidales bacterium]
MITIYHNSRCKKSRAGLSRLEEKGVDFEVKNYMKDGISAEELKDILIKMNVSPHEMIRTREADYKNKLKGKNFTDEEWIKIMIEEPRLIKRPIVVKKYKAVWADPPENMDILFDS